MNKPHLGSEYWRKEDTDKTATTEEGATSIRAYVERCETDGW